MRSLELSLESLSLEPPLSQNGQCLLSTALILPRPGIQLKSNLKSVQLRRGQANYRKAPFYQAGVLKEKVEGRFGLQVRLTAPQSTPEFKAMVSQLTAMGLETVGDFLAAGIQLSAVRQLVTSAFDQAADKVADTEDDFLLEGGLDLVLDDRTESARAVHLPLKLTRSLRINHRAPGPKTRDTLKPKTKTYKKGLTLGEAVFALREL